MTKENIIRWYKSAVRNKNTEDALKEIERRYPELLVKEKVEVKKNEKPKGRTK
jgi:hypothetical protein